VAALDVEGVVEVAVGVVDGAGGGPVSRVVGVAVLDGALVEEDDGLEAT
jgi:hypothetical protein